MASYANITTESVPLLPIATAPLATTAVLPLVLTITATYLYTVILAKRTAVNVPLIGLDRGNAETRRSKYFHDANSLLKEGYEKVRAGSTGGARGLG